jgi:hypothetical protein
MWATAPRQLPLMQKPHFDDRGRSNDIHSIINEVGSCVATSAAPLAVKAIVQFVEDREIRV